jgi:hypothetical protein
MAPERQMLFKIWFTGVGWGGFGVVRSASYHWHKNEGKKRNYKKTF